MCVASLACKGGGLTTSAFNGVEFGGWLVYCPALDNANFKGGGIMASRDVNWHPRLKPRTVFPSGFREDATKKGAK